MLAAMVRTGTRSRVRGGERDMRWAYPGRRTSTLLPRADGYRSGCRVPLSHATHADAASLGTAVNDARTSVVVITRNRREQVVRTLARLAELPERPPVILVDNASDDGTADLVRGLFPHVRVEAMTENLGAVARTVGVRAATTPYVAFSDDDSWWAPGALSAAADHFDAVPRLGLLAARIVVEPSGEVDPVCAQMASSPLEPVADMPGPPVLGFVACGSVVRRRAFLQVGGFHPVIFFAGEETVLAVDLASAGWGLAYVEDVTAHHQPEAGSERSGRRRLQTRNALLSSWLRRPAGQALRDTVRVLRRYDDPELRGALLDAARRRPAAAADRRPVPGHVETQLRLLEAGRG
jgi:GT2 family glycosyltransferase